MNISSAIIFGSEIFKDSITLLNSHACNQFTTLATRVFIAQMLKKFLALIAQVLI